MKITQKLFLGFSLLAFLVAVVGFYGLDASKILSQSYGEVSEEFKEEVHAAIEAQSYAKRAEGHLLLYLSFGDEIDKEKFFKRHQSLMEQYEILLKAVTTSGGQRQLTEIKKFSDEILQYGRQLLETYEISPATFDLKEHETLLKKFHAAARSVREHGAEIAKRRTIDAAIDISSLAKRAESHLILYLLLGDEIDREKFFIRHMSLIEQYEILEKAVLSPEGLLQLELLILSIGDISKYGRQLLEYYDNDPAKFDLNQHEALARKFHDSTSNARRQSIEITKKETNIISGNTEKLKKLSSSLQRKIAIIIIISTIIALLLSYYFSWKISRPLKDLKTAVSKISKGDYDVEIEKTNSTDEVGVLTRSFNEMSQDLAKYHLHLDELVAENTSELIATNKKYLEEINERKNLQGQLVHAQKMEAIGHLAGGIAHDFNNILSAIIGYTELALLESNPNGSVSDRLEKVREAANRAAKLVKQILAVSRQAEAELAPIMLLPVIKEVIKLIRATIPTTIEIQLDIGEESGNAVVMADPTNMHQVLLNLCTNAYYAMRESGGILRVATNIEKVDHDNGLDIGQEVPAGIYLSIEVSDTGHGMDNDNLRKIFEPYFTTKQKGEGTGLGLAVVHGIIQNCNGSINVSSRINEGTTFKILLPVTEKDSESSQEYNGGEIPRGDERLLVVDDEVFLTSIYREILGGLGYKVTARTSSVEALQLFQARPDDFDLILTDMAMPNITGLDLAKKILSIKPSMRIIVCTGFSSKIEEEKAKNIGIRGFIHKPLLMQELAISIRNVLEET